ncbi:hypothetical protein NEOLEDRAFT_158449 [Neolentinus lepideus HHB14362 ss-1]|uniref:Uncharacterized protein n=1 Tax=Neolentinus lepideus HHB14362 ss-1 TaxID=1314782 RepID=A0A165TT89_9AGAM|nr:hypothetical protein NEOLEDRAFT_158449 [Neolentinus lepideus HHB14362 ss-1]
MTVHIICVCPRRRPKSHLRSQIREPSGKHRGRLRLISFCTLVAVPAPRNASSTDSSIHVCLLRILLPFAEPICILPCAAPAHPWPAETTESP